MELWEQHEVWDEAHAKDFDKLADTCDQMAKEWAAQHHIDGYKMAMTIMVQKEVYKRMAYSMRQPRYMREESEQMDLLEKGDAV